MERRCLAFLGVMATMFASCSADLHSTVFLEKYGYLPKSAGSERGDDRTPEDFKKALIHFQQFAGITMTGILDQETRDKMQQSRCGVKDVFNAETPAGMPAHLKANVADRWPKKLLTWSVRKFSQTSTMSRERQLFVIRQGFRRWEEVTHLQFKEVTGKADIELSFEKYEHGDSDSFDGRGNTLAHAFPPVDGRTHFDDDEDWTEGVNHGTNLEHVATHEIGHALGLWHFPGTYPVMSPYYPGYVKDFKLHKYDIAEIQRRYGGKETGDSLNLPSFCGHEYKTIKAALRVDNKADFIFVDRKRVINGANGLKTRVRGLFFGGPQTVDAAAFSVLTNTSYLFSGEKVWAFTQMGPGQFVSRIGFPKDLHNSELRNPEAAVRVKDNDGMETILLIKGGKIWEWVPYYEMLAPGVGFPAEKLFPRIPDHMDAAISGDNIVNFIVGQKYYASDPTSRRTTKHGVPMKNLLKCTK